MKKPHCVKVYLDTSNVRSTDGNHAEEPMFPPSEECNPFIQHEKVMQPLGDIRRDREEFTWDEGQLTCHRSSTFNKRTNEMSTLFNDPGSGTVEPVVITRGEIDNAEVKGISRPDTGARGASPTFDSRTRTHLSRDFDGFEQVLGGSLGVRYRRIGCFAIAAGWAMTVLRSGIGVVGRVFGSLGTVVGRTNQLGQTVLDSVDLRELAMKYDLVISVGEGYSCAGSGLGGLDTKECIQRVGDSLDLFDLEVFDGTEVEYSSISRADLGESKVA